MESLPNSLLPVSSPVLRGHVEDERRVVGAVVERARRPVEEGGAPVGRGAVSLMDVPKDVIRRLDARLQRTARDIRSHTK